MRRMFSFVLMLAPLAACGPSTEPHVGSASPSIPSEHASAAPLASTSASSAPSTAPPAGWEPRITATPKWVVLGVNVVDIETGKRARTLPFGDIVVARDQEHFVSVGATSVTIGSLASDANDYRAAVDFGGNPALMSLVAPNGRAALIELEDGSLVVVDATAKKSSVVEDAHPRNVEVLGGQHEARTFTADGHAFAWVKGSEVVVRDVGTGASRSLKVASKEASAAEISENLAGGLFDDELLVVDATTGAEIFRKTGVTGFRLDEGGKTIGWTSDANGQALHVYDIPKKKEVGYVKLETATNTPLGKFAGACGGGPFAFSELNGTVARLDRECSLVDILRIDIATGAPPKGEKLMESHTPAEEAEDQAALEAALKKTGVNDFDAMPVWIDARKRIVLPLESEHVLAIFDTSSGKKLTTLATSSEQEFADAIRVLQGDKRIAGIDRNFIGRVWDTSSGKVLFEAKSDQP